jgi:hypothetical protein
MIEQVKKPTNSTEEAKLNLDDLDLNEIRVVSEEDAAALPETGASVGWNSCTRVSPK